MSRAPMSSHEAIRLSPMVAKSEWRAATQGSARSRFCHSRRARPPAVVTDRARRKDRLEVGWQLSDRREAHSGSTGVAGRILPDERTRSGDAEAEQLSHHFANVSVAECLSKHHRMDLRVWPRPRLRKDVGPLEMKPGISADSRLGELAVHVAEYISPMLLVVAFCAWLRGDHRCPPGE